MAHYYFVADGSVGVSAEYVLLPRESHGAFFCYFGSLSPNLTVFVLSTIAFNMPVCYLRLDLLQLILFLPFKHLDMVKLHGRVLK